MNKISNRIINLSGLKFNRLTILDLNQEKTFLNKRAYWNCKCDCGNITILQTSVIRKNRIKSCGCLRNDINRVKQTKHGMHDSKEYGIWCGMIQRCYNKKREIYNKYGGKGTKVCERWLNSFENFYNDIGERPSETSLDRINNNLHYSCGKCEECIKNHWILNCRWANKFVQANNTSRNHFINFNNERYTIAEWSKITGLSFSTISSRLNRKWSIEETLTIKSLYKI